ncbi:MAG: hypothetical protein N2167_03320 [Flavobacteriales bacterium]|nr:hypothetical protein [Flavobacteriales bacterium]
MKKLLFLFCFCGFVSCTLKYEVTEATFEKITTGPGPEDMVLDTFQGRNRLLISCSERRKKQPPKDEIWDINIDTKQSKILPRTNHPDSIIFHPHGVDLVFDENKAWLMVVNHEEKKNRHSILRYLVQEDELIFDTIFWNRRYLKSPNDVFADTKDKFWVTNDASSRNSNLELLLKIKGGNVVYFNGNSFVKSTPGLAFPNGIVHVENQLIVSTSRENKIFSFPLNDQKKAIASGKIVLAKAKGWDNFSKYNDTLLLCTAHVRPLKFINHYKHSNNKSPVAIYLINLKTKNAELLFYTDGLVISAGSTAIFYDGYLYVCQVFDPYIVKISLAK